MIPAIASDESFEGLVVTGGDGEPVVVSYPHDFYNWDEASEHLSLALNTTVFSLHIHDGDLWMYVLFEGGEEVDRFNPIPDYFSDELEPEELSSWAGDPALIARVWPDVEVSEIERYLTFWDLDDEAAGKAYDEDEHSYHDCWQLVDFMKKLGLPAPDPIEEADRGERYEFRVES